VARDRTGRLPLHHPRWDFVDRHAERFKANPRMATIVAAWRRRDEAARTAIRTRAAEVQAMADAGTL
jgi:deoxyribodipyrimidine photolyase-related protein